MQIVIKISQETYDEVKKNHTNEHITEELWQGVYHGTVLPEHGRLGDLDALEQYVIDKYSEGEQLAIDISDAPTILEAWGNEE